MHERSKISRADLCARECKKISRADLHFEKMKKISRADLLDREHERRSAEPTYTEESKRNKMSRADLCVREKEDEQSRPDPQVQLICTFSIALQSST